MRKRNDNRRRPFDELFRADTSQIASQIARIGDADCLHHSARVDDRRRLLIIETALVRSTT
jgi:hypothetical protein